MGKPTGFLEYERKSQPAVPPEERIKGWEEFHLPLSEKERTELFRVAASFGAEMMTLEVREHNTVAQRMYDEMDFLQQGRRKRYYSDTGEDALLLWNRDIVKTIEKNACLNDTYLLQLDSFLKGE